MGRLRKRESGGGGGEKGRRFINNSFNSWRKKKQHQTFVREKNLAKRAFKEKISKIGKLHPYRKKILYLSCLPLPPSPKKKITWTEFSNGYAVFE